MIIRFVRSVLQCLCPICVFILCVFPFVSFIYAADAVETIPLRIEVQEVKEFKIETTTGFSGSLDFGVLKSQKKEGSRRGLLYADASKQYAVIASVRSNTGRQYCIKHETYIPMRNSEGIEYKAVDDSGRSTDPLTCRVSPISTKTRSTYYKEGIKMTSFTAVKNNQILYLSDADGISDVIEIEYFLGRIVPTQRAGRYVGSITYSMVET